MSDVITKIIDANAIHHAYVVTGVNKLGGYKSLAPTDPLQDLPSPSGNLLRLGDRFDDVSYYVT
jgi:hypothetical protein